MIKLPRKKHIHCFEHKGGIGIYQKGKQIDDSVHGLGSETIAPSIKLSIKNLKFDKL